MKKTIVCMLLTFLLMLFALPVVATEVAQEPRAAIDLTPIFQAVIALLAALITGRLVPWIKSKTSGQQQSNIMATVRILVYAAEQMYGASEGDAKLKYVQEHMQERGYKLDALYLKDMIEAAVKELAFQQEAKPPSIPVNPEA